jgi:ParB-like chromosome segregation protein Spo0J
MDGDFVMDKILELAKQLADAIADLPLEEKVEALNQSRLILHKVSPFSFEPVDCVLWVEAGKVIANDYNPNSVARPEMSLLEHSMLKNGVAMPIVSADMAQSGPLVTRPHKTVDGFHRGKICKTSKKIRDRLHGYAPVANIAGDAANLAHLMSATVEFNRARGEHSVELMAGLVKEMIQLGQTDQEIAQHLGMEAEEVLRLKQMTGLAGLFKGQTYSKAWEAAT